MTFADAQKKAPLACAARGPNLTNGDTQCGGCGLSQNKLVASAQARAALRGIALHALEDDRGHALYVASRDALTRSFDDLAAVESWLDGLDALAAHEASTRNVPDADQLERATSTLQWSTDFAGSLNRLQKALERAA